METNSAAQTAGLAVQARILSIAQCLSQVHLARNFPVGVPENSVIRERHMERMLQRAEDVHQHLLPLLNFDFRSAHVRPTVDAIALALLNAHASQPPEDHESESEQHASDGARMDGVAHMPPPDGGQHVAAITTEVPDLTADIAATWEDLRQWLRELSLVELAGMVKNDLMLLSDAVLLAPYCSCSEADNSQLAAQSRGRRRRRKRMVPPMDGLQSGSMFAAAPLSSTLPSALMLQPPRGGPVAWLDNFQPPSGATAYPMHPGATLNPGPIFARPYMPTAMTEGVLLPGPLPAKPSGSGANTHDMAVYFNDGIVQPSFQPQFPLADPTGVVFAPGAWSSNPGEMLAYQMDAFHPFQAESAGMMQGEFAFSGRSSSDARQHHSASGAHRRRRAEPDN